MTREFERELIATLSDQVLKAVPPNGSERDVITYISRPMWRMWNGATGVHPDTEPTLWFGNEATRRVFGSETVVIDHDKAFAVSCKLKP